MKKRRRRIAVVPGDTLLCDATSGKVTELYDIKLPAELRA